MKDRVKSPLLVLDCHYLAHRAFHTTGRLSFDGKPTGVAFGFFRSVAVLRDEFQTDRIAFCFEHPHLFRRDIYPAYKCRRRNKKRTVQEAKALAGLALQISELRKNHLPWIGFKNIFQSYGMESDDLMAAVAFDPLRRSEQVILVTGDSDLYQCLREGVIIYSPQKKKILTEKWFIDKYGVLPKEWAKVKAITGCPTDEVEGIKGVGEVTALRFLRDELEESSKVVRTIRANLSIVHRNKALVKLPYENCPTPVIQTDEVSEKAWRDVVVGMGMKSIA